MELSQEWRDLVAWLDLTTDLLEIIGKIQKPAAGADFSGIFLYPEIGKLKVEKKTLLISPFTAKCPPWFFGEIFLELLKN